MPYVRIETVGDWLSPEAPQLFERIDEVLVAVLGVPPRDAFMRLHAHRPALTRLPEGADPRFVLLTVSLFPGRTPETKRTLYARLCAALGTLGIPCGAITIALEEIALPNWGLAGGIPASELAFGFEIER